MLERGELEEPRIHCNGDSGSGHTRSSMLRRVHAGARPPRVPRLGQPFLTAALACALFLVSWGIVSSFPGPFSTLDDNRRANWLAVSVFGGERTLVLVDDTRWFVERDAGSAGSDPWEAGALAGIPGQRGPITFYADVHSLAGGQAQIDLWQEVRLRGTSTWNPFRTTAPRCAFWRTVSAQPR